MPTTLIAACPLCGLRFSNNALFDLHLREDHLPRNRPAAPGHDDSGYIRIPRARAGGSSRVDDQASGQRRVVGATITTAPAHRPRSGRTITAARRATGALRYLNDELTSASEAHIRSARAPRPRRRPGSSRAKDSL